MCDGRMVLGLSHGHSAEGKNSWPNTILLPVVDVVHFVGRQKQRFTRD